ncbi:hypothetical protein Taro_010926 [Colocasia esculenta]|uniref:SCP domain-containing protein n=1 Tax=Colocasia esculenta TaxID=4460 RepID=A0A843U9K2_COLES|nr:hypothetical protein [Colocasia esculenta]
MGGLQRLREVVCSLLPRATETMAAAFFTSRRLLVAVATLALCAASSAVAARSRVLLADPPADKPNATALFLSEHNEARAAVGVAPLKWSSRLAGEASRLMRYQRDKKGCEFADLSSINYGANQAWSSYVAGPAEVVESWVEEKQYYNHSSNTCAGNHDCGTYTQVVWRKTLELGCAQVTCGKRDAGPALTLCYYFPHGNVQGQSPY